MNITLYMLLLLSAMSELRSLFLFPVGKKKDKRASHVRMTSLRSVTYHFFDVATLRQTNAHCGELPLPTPLAGTAAPQCRIRLVFFPTSLTF